MSNPTIAQYHWHADRGLALSRLFVWKDTAGATINVTGYSAKLTIRPDYDQTAILAVSSPTNIVVGTTDGKFQVTVDEDSMKFGDVASETVFVYDIVVIAPSGEPVKLVEGAFTMHPTAGP